VEPRIALGPRAILSPDLDQVRMGDDVEQPRAGELRLPLEVALPERVRVREGRPDVVAQIVDGAQIAEVVHGADDVVESMRVEQRRDPVLRPPDVVRLDPQSQRSRPNELAVGPELVDRLILPVGVLPDRE
jgi:hypothetical protein